MIKYLKETVEDLSALVGLERKVKARRYTSIRTGMHPTEKEATAMVRSPRLYDFLRNSI